MRTDVRVRAGEVTTATLNHRAARVTLKLVADEGGEAFAGTAFSVLTPGGDVVREAIGAFPQVVLAEGDYVLIARHEGRVFTREFRVESGPRPRHRDPRRRLSPRARPPQGGCAGARSGRRRRTHSGEPMQPRADDQRDPDGPPPPPPRPPREPVFNLPGVVLVSIVLLLAIPSRAGRRAWVRVGYFDIGARLSLHPPALWTTKLDPDPCAEDRERRALEGEPPSKKRPAA